MVGAVFVISGLVLANQRRMGSSATSSLAPPSPLVFATITVSADTTYHHRYGAIRGKRATREQSRDAADDNSRPFLRPARLARRKTTFNNSKHDI